MPKIENFRIIFDNPNSVYYGGQWVKGKVILTLNKSIKLSNINLRLQGLSICEWKEKPKNFEKSKENSSGSELISLEGKEIYFDHGFVLWSKKDRKSTLNAGSYEFPFQFQLPNNCPTSFEGTFGHIRYTATAKIENSKNQQSNDSKNQFTAGFTVIQILDLNKDPILKLPAKSVNQRKIRNFFCGSGGQIECLVEISRQGFVPGEFLQYVVEIRNESRKNVKEVRICFVQSVTFRAGPREHRNVTKILCENFDGRSKKKNLAFFSDPKFNNFWNFQGIFKVFRNFVSNFGSFLGIQPGETRKISTAISGNEKNCNPQNCIQIPPVPPATNGSVISISYHLEAICKPNGTSNQLVTAVPVIIGSIPIRQKYPAPAIPPAQAQAQPPATAQNFQQFPTPAIVPNSRPHPILPTAPDSKQFPIPNIIPNSPKSPGFLAPPQNNNPTAPPFEDPSPDMPPPSYEECISSEKNVINNDDFNFVPKYGCFKGQ